MAEEFPEFFDPVEDCDWCSPRKIFARYGYAPPPLDGLGPGQLRGRLWELLYAAAGRRQFFHATDHLSDREFYQLLMDRWLDEPTADIPLAAETNTTTIISEYAAGGLSAEEIYLRYYADEDEFDLGRQSVPNPELPTRVDPPFDRDRFLPRPPMPFAPDLTVSSGADDSAWDDDSDPLGLASVDEEIAAIAKEPPGLTSIPGVGSEPGAPGPDRWVAPIQRFAEENLPLLPPDEITDEALPAILWELLHHLSRMGFYLRHSDHLNDRDLYGVLWTRVLRQSVKLPADQRHWAWYHDLSGKLNGDRRPIWVPFPATDGQLAESAMCSPESPMPQKESPAWRRDWRLPQGPFCD